MMKKTTFLILAGLMASPLVPSSWAQGRDGFGPPPDDGSRGRGPRGGFGGNDGPRGPRPPREKGELMRVWRDIDRLQHDEPRLSKAQAKRVVALVLPVSKKPQLSATEAQNLRQKLEAVLTSAQKTSLDDGPRDRGERPGPPDGPGRSDGPPRDGGRRRGERGPGGRWGGGREMGDGPAPPTPAEREVVRAWLENSNPFYAPTGTANWKRLPVMFQKDAARRYKENRATLEALSRASK